MRPLAAALSIIAGSCCSIFTGFFCLGSGVPLLSTAMMSDSPFNILRFCISLCVVLGVLGFIWIKLKSVISERAIEEGEEDEGVEGEECAVEEEESIVVEEDHIVEEEGKCS